jgi:hypothetical protein
LTTGLLLLLAITSCTQNMAAQRIADDQNMVENPVRPIEAIPWLSLRIQDKERIFYGPPQEEWKDGLLDIKEKNFELGGAKVNYVKLSIDAKHGYANIEYEIIAPKIVTILPVEPGPYAEISWSIYPIVSNGPIDCEAQTNLTLQDKVNRAFIYEQYPQPRLGTFRYAVDRSLPFTHIPNAATDYKLLIREQSKPIHYHDAHTLGMSAHYIISSEDFHNVNMYFAFSQSHKDQ